MCHEPEIEQAIERAVHPPEIDAEQPDDSFAPVGGSAEPVRREREQDEHSDGVGPDLDEPSLMQQRVVEPAEATLRPAVRGQAAAAQAATESLRPPRLARSLLLAAGRAR